MGRLNIAGLLSEHDVPDTGCGVGQTGRICDYLDDGLYEGFDIMGSPGPREISACQR